MQCLISMQCSSYMYDEYMFMCMQLYVCMYPNILYIIFNLLLSEPITVDLELTGFTVGDILKAGDVLYLKPSKSAPAVTAPNPSKKVWK